MRTALMRIAIHTLELTIGGLLTAGLLAYVVEGVRLIAEAVF